MQTVLANKDEVILQVVKLSYLQMLVLTVKEKKVFEWVVSQFQNVKMDRLLLQTERT